MLRFNRILRIASIALFAGTLTIAIPQFSRDAKAIVYEDCDLDGYDDATGASMPWIGFDATKGDEIPSDWDGKTIYGSKAEYRKAHEKKEQVKQEQSQSSSEKNVQQTTSSQKSSSKTAEKKTVTSVKKTSGTANKADSKRDKKDTKKSDKSKVKESKKADSKKDKAKDDKESKSKKDDKDSEKSDKKDKKAKKEEKKADKSDSKESDDELLEDEADSSTGADEESSEEPAAVVSDDTSENSSSPDGIKLTVRESDGSLIHAGGNLTITGEGTEIEGTKVSLELRSDNKISLGEVVVNDDGIFELNAQIPENLEPGEHEVVAIVDGKDIVSNKIQVGRKGVETFAEAFLVGFDGTNAGFVPGLLILIILGVLSAVGYIVGGVVKKGKK